LGSEVHDTKDILDGRISCRLTFVTLTNFQSLIRWLLKCLTHKEIWRNVGTFQTTSFDQHSTAESVEKLSDMIFTVLLYLADLKQSEKDFLIFRVMHMLKSL